jgi:hypothetical protein
MTYFKVDDHFHSHPKILDLGLDAVGLWTLAGSWSGEQLTDGFIPSSLIARLGGSPETAQALVDAGLWEIAEGGYLFHDWDAHNQTKAQVIESRELWRSKKEKQRGYRTSSKKDGVSSLDAPFSFNSVDSIEGIDEMSLGDTLGDSLGESPGESLGESRESPGTRNKEQGTRNRNKEQGTRTKELGTRKTEVEKRYSEDFEDFWSVYPRRVAKIAAYAAWRKALLLTDAGTVIAGARAYADDPNRQEDFTAHPASWLNAGRWEDDPLPERGTAQLSKSEMNEKYSSKLDRQIEQYEKERLDAASRGESIIDFGEWTRRQDSGESRSHQGMGSNAY